MAMSLRLWRSSRRQRDITTNTLVVQSFRAHDVPSWIQACMQSVREWAGTHEFKYRFVGDEFFSCIPDWFREKTRGELTILSDLARLELIKTCLTEGFARVIWCDADIVVCCPELFNPPDIHSFGFSREIWSFRNDEGELCASTRVNNSICFFQQDSMRLLLDLIEQSKTIIALTQHISSNLIIGTLFLTQLHARKPLPLIQNTGLTSPTIINALICSDIKTIAQFRQWHQEPLYALNLCNFFRNRQVSDNIFSSITDQLLRTRGAIINSA
jgi:hypothetical protein